jgi:hypothetical protein
MCENRKWTQLEPGHYLAFGVSVVAAIILVYFNIVDLIGGIFWGIIIGICFVYGIKIYHSKNE